MKISKLSKNEVLPIIAILGGTGDLGTGLALRWVQAGYPVIIGSRTENKARVAVDDIVAIMRARGVNTVVNVEAMENLAAATKADICALTVPFVNQAEILTLVKETLKGKILVDSLFSLFGCSQ